MERAEAIASALFWCPQEICEVCILDPGKLEFGIRPAQGLAQHIDSVPVSLRTRLHPIRVGIQKMITSIGYKACERAGVDLSLEVKHLTFGESSQQSQIFASHI